MPAKSLTDAFCKTVKLPLKTDKPNQISYLDTLERGLALQLIVSYGGSKTFRAITYRSGKPHSVKLGTYPSLTVKAARAQARAYWQDPKKFEAQATAGTFKDIATQWLKLHVQPSKLRSQAEIERILSYYVYPRWKDVAFLEIRRGEVNDLLDNIAVKHGRPQSDAVLMKLSALMAWYQRRNENYTSPIIRGMKRCKTNGGRNRFLNNEEIRQVWAACEGTFGAVVKFALLVGQRREKIAGLQWSDIDDEGYWTIRTAEREKSNAGKIKLSAMALSIVEAQPRIAGNSFVFASSRGRNKPFAGFGMGKRRLDARLPDMPHWTIHDLRRSCRKLMTRAGVRPDVAELALGHSIKGIQKIYDDKIEYRPMVDIALQSVADEIAKILNPLADNVVVGRAAPSDNLFHFLVG